MEEKPREVTDLEKQFVMLLGYFIYKYCDGKPAELDHDGFINFMDKNPQLERMDQELTSYYKVSFNEGPIH